MNALIAEAGGSVRRRLPMFVMALSVVAATPAAGPEWVDLSGLDAWKGPATSWEAVGDSSLNPKNPARLTGEPGRGVFYNGPLGRALNLVSKADFNDVEFHAEFMIPKGSNSGVKFEGVYEVQIFDSHDVKTLKASHCGGIYPRAELLPKYHYLDDGYPPKINACKAPGEWQTLDVVFHAPKFDDSGKKTADARFVSVTLNGKVVQENLSVPCPTGNNWRNKEQPKGPILLQGDHGPVAFRNVRARPIERP